jgi:COMPASS component SWD1
MTVQPGESLESENAVHLTVMLASSNGSLMVWSARPSKFIQPLAPNFIEIEDNVEYVEKEDEFESEMSDDGNMMDIDDDVVPIEPLSSKQKKLNGLVETPDFSLVQTEHI